MKKTITLRGNITRKQQIVLTIIGTIGFLATWHMVTIVFKMSPGVFPSPIKVIAAFPELHFEYALVRNALYSLQLNLLGLAIAFAAAFPLGFILGLNKYAKGLMEKHVLSFRFIPLTILTGVFISWFGLEDLMKIMFLAFGVFVYLLPTVIQRVKDVEEVYEQTAKTCGANNWQTIRTVFIPAVGSKFFDDLRILSPISWTYIIIAEMLNKTGGIGALAWSTGRSGQADKTFAIMLTIIMIAVIMDWLNGTLDKLFFPYKYA